MKYLFRNLILCCILLIGIPMHASEYFIKISNESNIEMINNDIRKLLILDEEYKETEYRKAFEVLKDMGLDRVYLAVVFRKLSEIELNQIGQIKGVEYIETVPEYKWFYTPNDYGTNSLWHLNKIDAKSAWDLSKGGNGIIIGLVDDGLDTLHSDIQPVLWHNKSEIKGNGIDDDNNGYIDDFFGWDVADSDNDPSVINSNGLSHGTHCGGIAAAKTDNNNGIASIGFNTQIMAIKTGRSGSTGLFNAYRGVEYAIVNKANIISMSWGGGSFSNTYQTLFNVAYARNIVCVAAAGNDYDTLINYPAGYKYVIAVGATDINDRKSNYSCYGSWIDVMAPGSSIYSTIPGNSYANKSGTSMACPLVSGLCALMLSRNPTLSVAAVESCLKSTCDNINSQNSQINGLIGAGRINAYQALRCVKSVNANYTSTKTFVCTGDTIRFYDNTLPSSGSRLWSFPGGTPNASTATNPIVRYNSPGLYKVQLISTVGGESDTIEKLNYVQVGRPSVRFSGSQTILKGDIGTIKAEFTVGAPWDLIYSDGVKFDTIRKINNTPYFIMVVPEFTSTYIPISVKSGTCVGTFLDSARIIVNPNVNNSCDSSLRFHLSFGGSGDDIGYDVAVGSDSNFYVSGYTRSRGAGNEDAFAARINVNGKIVWYKTFGNSGSDQFSTITLDENENMYLCGNSFPNSSSSDKMMLIVKLDKNGVTKWYKQFSGNSIEYMKSCLISEFSNNAVYFSGPMVSNSYGGEDFMLMKCDTNGNILWQKHYGTSSYTDRPEDLVEDKSGNIYICGSSNGQNLIMKIDSIGTLIWSKIYFNPNGNTEAAIGTTLVGDNLYTATYGGLVSGSSWNERELIVMKTAPNGTIIWSNKYVCQTQSQMTSMIRIRSIGNSIYVSWALNRTGSDGFLMCLDTNGNIIRYTSIGDNNSQIINSHFVHKDESITYVGTESSGNNEIMLGKTNCKLKTFCKTASNTLSFTTYNMNSANYTVSSRNSTLSNYTGLSISNHVVNSNISCITKSSTIKSKCNVKADFTYLYSCNGDSVIFYDLSLDSFGVIAERNWNFGDGNKISASTSIVKHLYKSTGNYNIELIVKSISGNSVCTDTFVNILDANSLIGVSVFPKDTMICLGDSIQLNEPNIFCGKGPFTYIWSPSIGLDDINISRPFFAPKINTNYTLQVKDSEGKTAITSVNFIVDNNCCKSKARFSASKDYACPGDSIRFYNISTYEPNSYYFKWTFTGANTQTFIGFEPPPFLFDNSGIYSITLELSDLCSNDTVSSQFRVRKLPIANAGRDTVLCRRDTIQIGSEAFGRNQYIWSPTEGLNDGQLSDPILISESPQTFLVKVTDEFGCKNIDSVFVDFRTRKFVINSDSLICKNDSIQLLIPGLGDYLWYNGSTQRQIKTTAPSTVWGQLTNDCIYRDTIQIGLLPGPIFNLGKDTGFCMGKTMNIGANINGSYLWNTGAITQSIVVNQTGTYWLKVTDSKCSNYDTINITRYSLPIFSLGSDKVICEDSISIIPNPLFLNEEYLWNNGMTSKEIKVATQGKYFLKIKDSNNCDYSDTIFITQGLLPQIEPINLLYKCEGFTYTVNLPFIAGQSYRWYDQTFGNSKLIKDSGSYFVTAITECGDSTIRFNLLDSNCFCKVWLPNAFSPNGDMLNDYFGVSSQCNLIEFKMKIYTHWGELIFETNDYNAHWDGTYKGEKVPLGMYMYIIEYRTDMPGFKEYFSQNGTFLLK